MSRIGNNPVKVPPKVEVTLATGRDLGQGPARHADAAVRPGCHRRAERRGAGVHGGERRCERAAGHAARARREHGQGRDAGLREEADARGRRLPRAGGRRQDQPVARLLASGRAQDAEGRDGADAGADRNPRQGHRQAAGRTGRRGNPRLSSARAVQGQGRSLRRRARQDQGNRRRSNAGAPDRSGSK